MQVTGTHRALRHHVEMIGVFGLGLAVNDSALNLLAQAAPNAGSTAEVVALLASGGIATLARVLLMFPLVRRRRHTAGAGRHSTVGAGRHDGWR
jgi:hypothetical protein